MGPTSVAGACHVAASHSAYIAGFSGTLDPIVHQVPYVRYDAPYSPLSHLFMRSSFASSLPNSLSRLRPPRGFPPSSRVPPLAGMQTFRILTVDALRLPRPAPARRRLALCRLRPRLRRRGRAPSRDGSQEAGGHHRDEARLGVRKRRRCVLREAAGRGERDREHRPVRRFQVPHEVRGADQRILVGGVH